MTTGTDNVSRSTAIIAGTGSIVALFDFLKPVFVGIWLLPLIGFVTFIVTTFLKRTPFGEKFKGELVHFQLGGATAAVAGAVFLFGSFFFDGKSKRGLIVNALSIEKVQDEMMSSIEGIEQNTSRTADSMEELNARSRNFARETSKDPRKELAKMGIPWRYNGFSEVLESENEELIALFMNGGWPLNQSFLESAMNGYEEHTIRTLWPWAKSNTDPRECEFTESQMYDIAIGVKERLRRDFLVSACGKGRLRTHFKRLLSVSQKARNEGMAKYNEQKISYETCRKNWDPMVDAVGCTFEQMHFNSLEKWKTGKDRNIRLATEILEAL